MSARTFFGSMAVLAALMLVAGVLTRTVPTGSFERSVGRDGALTVVPGSYEPAPRPDYPAWRWLTAPFEVLASEDAALAIVIIVFIAVVGGSFAVLKDSGVLEESVRLLAARFRSRRYLLLIILCLFFMAIGGFMGVFEEVVPLVPLAMALSISLGWDAFTGMGMSILATGFGFAAAVSNPFSIGTAQKLAGVPMLSGSGFRLAVFAAVAALYLGFMLSYVRRLDKASRLAGQSDPVSSSGQGPGRGPVNPDGARDAPLGSPVDEKLGRGVRFFARAGLALGVIVAASSVTRIAADFILPIIALGYLAIGAGAGLAAGYGAKPALKSFSGGVAGILPAGVLILMALSVKRIVVEGGIMDTILDAAARALDGASEYKAAGLMYLVVLGMEFFIGSASAKAFLLMPLLGPLADLSGLSRQIAVQAYAFGDGFSNMIYPTNAVLLISLGLAGMSWGQWFKKTWKLQTLAFLLTMALLMAAVYLGYK